MAAVFTGRGGTVAFVFLFLCRDEFVEDVEHSSGRKVDNKSRSKRTHAMGNIHDHYDGCRQYVTYLKNVASAMYMNTSRYNTCVDLQFDVGLAKRIVTELYLPGRNLERVAIRTLHGK